VLGLAVPGAIGAAVGSALGAAVGAAVGEEDAGAPPTDGPGEPGLEGPPGEGEGDGDDEDDGNDDDDPEEEQREQEEEDRRRQALLDKEATFFTDQDRQERLVGYFNEWAQAHPEGFDPDAFTAFANKQEESAFYQLNFQIWRSSNPEAPATEFIDSGSWYDQAKAGRRAGNVEDATMETIDAISLLMGAPGMVKGATSLTMFAMKGLKNSFDDLLTAAVKRELNREAWKIVDAVPGSSADKMAALFKESPAAFDAFISSADDDAMRELFHRSTWDSIEGNALAQRITQVLGEDAERVARWHRTEINRQATGEAGKILTGALSYKENTALATSWLKNNAQYIDGPLPTPTELLQRWGIPPP
jgi:hypothetical protein